jgi:hypothetical protein
LPPTAKFITIVLAILTSFWLFAGTGQPVPNNAGTPVLVELFTSEGCSSCPPADAFLRQLDTQPIPGAQVIVLSEHVDYWDHLGWRDIYSSHALTERQNAYASHFGLSSAYTPQMVVDGNQEFVGSNLHTAQEVLTKNSKNPKLAIQINDVKTDPDGTVRARIDVPALPEGLPVRDADVYVALALNHAVSQVKHGENEGREISHVAVVRELVRVGSIKRGTGVQKDIRLKVKPIPQSGGMRLIAFVQSPGPGAILGATLMELH